MERVTYEEVFGKYESGALIVVEGRPGSGRQHLHARLQETGQLTAAQLRMLIMLFCFLLEDAKKNYWI